MEITERTVHNAIEMRSIPYIREFELIYYYRMKQTNFIDDNNRDIMERKETDEKNAECCVYMSV